MQQELKLPIGTQQRTKPTNWNSRIQYRNGFQWKPKQEEHVQWKGTEQSEEQVQQIKGNHKRKQLNQLKLKNYKKTKQWVIMED